MKRRTLVAVLAWLLTAGAPPLAAQQRQVSGTVVGSERGEPLANARVTISGTNRGVQTGADGRFTLSVGAGDARLTVSRLGYVTREVAVPAAQDAVTVRLDASVLSLDALVVTGQATNVARRNLANAVASVSGEELNRAPAQTVDKALAGRVPGASINTNSGAPGGGVQVALRGVSSINAGADPLWVIDGVVVSNVSIASGQNAITGAISGDNASIQDNATNRISDLNPEDIESIEILKGASAAAIYGSKASNGVIIVTTRRGREGAPRVTVSQRLGYYELSNTLGSRRFTLESALAAFAPPPPATGTSADTAAWQANRTRITGLYGDGTHYDHEVELAGRRSLGRETAIGISGGSAGTRYYVSGLVMDEPGIIAGSGFEKHSLRMNLDQQVGRGIELSVNTNLLRTNASRGLTNNDNRSVSYYMALSGTPAFVDLRARDGVFPHNPFAASNPLQTAELLRNDEGVWRFIGSGSARVPVVSGDAHSLRLVMSGGADYFQQRNRLVSPPILQFEQLGSNPGTSILGNSDNLNLNGNANLVHTWSPGAWTATTSLGLQYEDRDLTIARIITRDLVAGQENVDAGPAPRVFHTRSRVRDLGVFAQEELLMLDSRLFLTGGIRADRGSNNGDTEQYYLYPKASASYRFPGFAPTLDELKVRLAYGETGNQPLYGQKFTAMNATNNIGGLPGLVVVGTAGSANIRPERQRELEGGFDAAFLGGRASLEATGYYQRITELLLTRTTAPSTGFVSEVFNGGELHTRGVELSLNAEPLRRERLGWSSRTTFATNRSTIEKLPVPPFRTGAFGSTSLGVFQIEEGKSATQIIGLAGHDADGRVLERLLGDANPKWKMGFSNELTMGRLRLSSLFDWQHGGSVINLTRLLYDASGTSPDWELPAGVTAPRPVDECHPACSGVERISGFGTFTQQYIEDASFVKLRELSLGWRLPPSLLERAPGRVGSATVTLSGRNLVTWTDYTGLDPEVSNFGNQQIARNVDVAPFPPSRSFWLTFNFEF